MPAVSALVFANLMRSPLAIPNGLGAWLIPAYPIVLMLPRFYNAENPAWWQSLLRDLPIPLAANLVVWGLCAAWFVRSGRRSLLERAPPDAQS